LPIQYTAVAAAASQRPNVSRRSVAALDDTWRIEMKCAFRVPTATRCCSCSMIVKGLTTTSPVGHNCWCVR